MTTPLGKVLAVDDDAIVLSMMSEFLEEAGYQVVTANSGKQALDILEDNFRDIDAMILDRIMEDMDGMDVLAVISSDSRLIELPVIMQTSVSSPEHVLQGIRAGAYYYLAKPFDGEKLVQVVAAAIEKFHQFRKVMAWGIEAMAGLSLLQQGVFEVRTLQEGRMATNLIADLAERPAPVTLGLMELITNSIENGNCGVDYLKKRELVKVGAWDEDIHRAQALASRQGKFVSIAFSVNEQVVTVCIKDMGAGFDWRPYVDLDPSRACEAHGRGIVIARAFCFDSLTYEEGGTRVTVQFRAA